MDLVVYTAKKREMNNAIDGISAVAQSLGLNQVVKKLAADKKALNDEQFRLVVVGEFSRGKSTFVNAMLGRIMLPASKQPTTNVISKIVYGNKPSYTLHYRDGQEKEIGEEEFLGIKAQSEERESLSSRLKGAVQNAVANITKKNLHVENIEYAEIAYPLSFCRDQVEVVDTPGTNDLNVGRMEITINYIDKADAAILVLSAAQALTQSELDFLKEQLIGKHIEDIFVVVNYKDSLESSAEEERVLRHVKENICQYTGKKPRIFLVSSRQALLYRRKANGEELKSKQLREVPSSLEETGFSDFEEALGRYLSEEKGLTKLRKYATHLNTYTREIEQSISMKLTVVDRSADDVKQQLKEMKPKFDKTKQVAEQILAELCARIQSGEMEMLNQARRLFGQMRQAAVNSIDGYQDGMSEADVKYLVNKAITPIQKKMYDEMNQFQQNLFYQETQRAYDRLRTLWTDIKLHSASLTVIEEQQTDLSFSVDTKREDAQGLGALAGGVIAGVLGFGALGFFVGAWLGAKAAGEYNKKDIPTELRSQVRSQMAKQEEAVMNKIRSQYRQSVERFTSSLQADVFGRIDDMESQLKQIIREKESKELTAQEQRDLLCAKREKIHLIGKTVMGVVNK